jgi:hypothetical protein
VAPVAALQPYRIRETRMEILGFFASRRVDSITMLNLRQLGTCITTLRLERGT